MKSYNDMGTADMTPAAQARQDRADKLLKKCEEILGTKRYEAVSIDILGEERFKQYKEYCRWKELGHVDT